MNLDIIPHKHAITAKERIQRNGYRPYLIWFTGLSGSGKSTLASALEHKLFGEGYQTYILDGDNVRTGLNRDLDFTDSSRKENIRRISEVSALFLDAGVMVLTAFISPFKEDREQARAIVGTDRFIEVFVDTPIEICEQRDVKGLYKKAREGKIPNFTGIDSPFQSPASPDIHIKTENQSIEDSLAILSESVIQKIKS
jgi:adenylylsulfate kinase